MTFTFFFYDFGFLNKHKLSSLQNSNIFLNLQIIIFLVIVTELKYNTIPLYFNKDLLKDISMIFFRFELA